MALRPGRDRDSGLTSLLADVLRSDTSDEDLLVRYADDPAALDAEERARIERELQSSAARRDQLRVLQHFDLAAMLASETAPVRTVARVEAVDAPSLWQRARDLLRGRTPLVLGPLAAAALLAIVWLRSGAPELRPPGAPPPGPMAQVERPTEPEPPSPETRKAPEPQRIEIAKAPPPRPEPVPAPKPKAEPPAPELDYIAMAEPVYAAPFGAPEFETEATYIRGATAGVTLSALAPRHVARTVSGRPSLFWYLSALPAGSPKYALTIANDDDTEPLLQVPLASPARAGLQRVDLAGLGVDLPLGVPLRWSVALRVDPENPSSDVIAQGAIERVAEPAELAAKLASARPLDRPSVYAGAGVWYDALAELDRIARNAPGEAVPLARLRSLLEGAGIPEAERIAP